jgi:hypothetical protein
MFKDYVTPRILLRIHTGSLKKFRESAKINPDICNDIIFFGNFIGTLLQNQFVCVQLDPRPTREKVLIRPNFTKMNFLRILRLRGMRFIFEYLGRIYFIF